MKNKFLIMGILSAFLSCLSCESKAQDFRSVSVEEFEQVIADTTVVRLDVRTAEEYAEGHIIGALNIDALKEDFEQKVLAILPKDKIIALYCRSGNRSKKAAQLLTEKGYLIIELSTGYKGWSGAGKAIVQ